MLTEFSNQVAEVVAGAAPSVVQVHARRRPASGVVYADGIVVTTMRALGREDGIRVRVHEGETIDAELAGWDPATSLAVVRVPGLKARPLQPARASARVGHLAIAVARSWSNVITASAGIVSVIGGPLPTGRRRAIDQVIRTTAPMHDGFAGGAFLDTAGGLLGIATAAETGVYGPEGKWLIEGHGVDPDIVVDNNPASTFAGSDAQLEATVRHLLEELKKNPNPVPRAPAYPKK